MWEIISTNNYIYFVFNTHTLLQTICSDGYATAVSSASQPRGQEAWQLASTDVLLVEQNQPPGQRSHNVMLVEGQRAYKRSCDGFTAHVAGDTRQHLDRAGQWVWCRR
jgi:hypothetical protein